MEISISQEKKTQILKAQYIDKRLTSKKILAELWRCFFVLEFNHCKHYTCRDLKHCNKVSTRECYL